MATTGVAAVRGGDGGDDLERDEADDSNDLGAVRDGVGAAAPMEERAERCGGDGGGAEAAERGGGHGRGGWRLGYRHGDGQIGRAHV